MFGSLFNLILNHSIPSSVKRDNQDPCSTISLTLPVQPLVIYINEHLEDGSTLAPLVTGLGYRYMHIQDPHSALLMISEHLPAIVCLAFDSVVATVPQGHQICERIRQIPSMQTVPILLTTQRPGFWDWAWPRLVGGSGVIAKPFRREAIQKWLITSCMHL